MHILRTPFQYVRNQRARRKRMRTVLHILAASGVIRPSHVERRYFERAPEVDALYRRNSPSGPVASPTL